MKSIQDWGFKKTEKDSRTFFRILFAHDIYMEQISMKKIE